MCAEVEGTYSLQRTEKKPREWKLYRLARRLDWQW